ncbi:MAG: sugar phosphate isomerase/epimerase [Planctomycetota bacterium]|nr:sugar phosphate isomerase/epimerase [Planctomycetota bacterium]
MSLICFTKLLKPWNAAQLIEFAKKEGLTGYDVTVRDGYPVTPEKVGTELVPFVRQLTQGGLKVPMITFGSRAYAVDDPLIERAWAASAEAGVKGIKLGYWVWKKEGPHYWDQVAAIRKDLARYAKLAEKYGVQALFHTHSGPYYGLNASSLMHCLQDVNPKHVGAYVDPCHLSLDGEPLEMAIDILRGRIAMVAVKNSYYEKQTKNGKLHWHRGVCPLHEGLVDWEQAVKLFKAAGYAGYYNLHGEYDHREEVHEVLEVLVPDIRIMRQFLGQ